MTPLLPTADLEAITTALSPHCLKLKNAQILLTGGSGFFGIWILYGLIFLSRAYQLNLKITSASRHKEQFAIQHPFLNACPELESLSWDVSAPYVGPQHPYHFIIHAATTTQTSAYSQHPLASLDTMINGTKNTLNIAATGYSPCRFLFVSSGAVYGPQPWDLSHIPEDYVGAPNPLLSGSVYGEGKRMGEQLCSLYAKQFPNQISWSSARCFAFVGPFLPLDQHFAIGNFLQDAMNHTPITIKGDGKTVRSYLYTSDLVVWLIRILLNGANGEAYNVGSEDAFSMVKLAQNLTTDVHVLNKEITPASRYVPNTQKIQQELGIQQTVSLHDALQKTLQWHQWMQGNS